MSLNTFDLYLFGGTGDLSNRKLIPAMFRQETLSSICTESNIIGIGSRNLTTVEYVEMVKDSLQKYFPNFDQHKDTWKLFSARISYIQIDINSDEGWNNLKEISTDRAVIYYLATPPNLIKTNSWNEIEDILNKSKASYLKS